MNNNVVDNHGHWIREAESRVDNLEDTDEDQPMTNPTKDEMNARLEAVEARVETRLVSIESKIDAQFAELKSELHKGNSDTIKWVAGIVLTVMALGLTIMTFVLNNAIPKKDTATQSTPIVIYTQPAPAPAAPTPQK